jgi:hypothetical protein
MCCSNKTARASLTCHRGRSLSTRDHLVCWPKPAARPQWMTPEQYADFPDELTVREARVSHQVLVTTLVDHRHVSKDDLSELYARRWNVELDLRNLKTTTGMDVLSCQTPQMNNKQLWVHLLAYNVIRLLMAQAWIASTRKSGPATFILAGWTGMNVVV